MIFAKRACKQAQTAYSMKRKERDDEGTVGSEYHGSVSFMCMRSQLIKDLDQPCSCLICHSVQLRRTCKLSSLKSHPCVMLLWSASQELACPRALDISLFPFVKMHR